MKLSQEQLDALRDQLRLSPRETQILDLLFQGHTSNQLLAEHLGITLGTAKGMVGRVLLKTGAADKTQLVLRCFEILADVYAREFFTRRQKQGPA